MTNNNYQIIMWGLANISGVTMALAIDHKIWRLLVIPVIVMPFLSGFIPFPKDQGSPRNINDLPRD